MALVKVKANRLGYYNHKRVREDAVFLMDEKHMKKLTPDMNRSDMVIVNDKFVLPSWVTLVGKSKPKPEPEILEEEEIQDEEVI